MRFCSSYSCPRLNFTEESFERGGVFRSDFNNVRTLPSYRMTLNDFVKVRGVVEEGLVVFR